MPPTPCPALLRKLIDRLNKQSGDEARETSRLLRLILEAVRKHQQGKGPATYVLNIPSEIIINLTDYSSHIRNELASALADIDPPDLIERVRECPVEHCNTLFWASRDNKRVRVTSTWIYGVKGNIGEKRKVRESKSAAERQKEQATKTFEGMTKTARSVIRAIMAEGARSFGDIDGHSWQEFYYSGKVPRSTEIVRNVTHRLYKDGYLEYFESADHRDRRGFSNYDRYNPTQKLTDLWNDTLES